ncbi:MAG: hypothetical protein DME00_06870 [Candidatus Rokuibacteriota bacterium]|nr:MAG: hypothetical protein DME00_06870 [Candidatus Rokubacteria bacterium]PYO10914.1 MAG: hypothetical protein DMD75_12170 [Candidatus Rokubacteria bacterium]
MSVSRCVESNPKCSSPWWALASPGPRRSPVRAPEMFTPIPPSSLWQRMKRSPKTRVSSLMILKLKALTYHSAVFRGSGAFRWMWLMRNAMTRLLGSCWNVVQELVYTPFREVRKMGQLDGRTVLITGAARGIGAACAHRLAADGARLVLADLDPGVEKVARELGQVAIRADVTRRDDIVRMVEEPYRRWGRLDVLFNNAGVIRVQPMLDVSEAEWDRVMTVNLRAVFFVLQAVSRRMVRQDPIAGSELRGKLIQTASIASYRGGNHLMTPYSASKAGVVSLTRSAAQALARERITSNCVCPGAVETAMWEQIDKEWGALEGLGQGEAWKRRIRGIPLGRPERPEDVAKVVAFLAGPDSDYMTGQALNVDGGLVMGN